MKLKLTIDRFEGDKAVLKTEDDYSVIWPKSKLPAEARAGTVFIFNITDKKEDEKDKKELAKNILNEILGTGKGLG